ncbi:CRISPR-associated endonuclease Cas9/Csn1 [Aeoliella mucimassa]|uniref:CRISPR-associated endonuclease Cas9 n=1 Tax=Aeoliella mucimassa TaxID=2527972 RepID=A0A518APU9_9BACT|nr:CRISPR-associated endonuclease Cas9/Csn1 [Aeoliella mucimassa]
MDDLKLISDRRTAHVVPYTLRARALDGPLPLYALGRAFYHLAQRRGFLSNLKAGRGDEETGKVKQGISQLSKDMETSGARTLGEHFAGLDADEQRIRQRWTSRQMYQDEFEAIWRTQIKHHPHVLTQKLKEELSEAIFHQRPLKSQRHLIGKCDLEPRRRRAAIASLPYQQFRVLQRVNDLRVESELDLPRPLTHDEREQLLIRLTVEGDLSWNEVKKTLGLRTTKKQPVKYTFNFEGDGEKKLIGNRTAAKFSEALGQPWDDMDEPTRTRLVDSVLTFEDEQPLLHHLQQHWQFGEQQAVAVANLTLEAGYGNISRRAINKLRPLMEQGQAYSTARRQIYPESFEARPPEERLPPFSQVAPTVRNPTLARAMAELRKVVNALVAQYGKPRFIRIELARDLKRSRKDRQQFTDQRDRNTKSRDDARKRLLDRMGKAAGEQLNKPHNILKIRLAEECGWVCPFTGRGIEMETLVGDSPQFDIEHIIPYSKSLDNSYMNKTLCYHEENRHVKRNQTPYQAYHSTEQWEDIIARVKHFKGSAANAKLAKFLADKLPEMDEFAERQLSDTRYLSRAATDYLATLYGGRVDGDGKLRVQASPGRLTAILRRAWQLNRIGYGDPEDGDQKDRADHRHHAIDAFVVAVTTTATVHAANRAASRAESYYARDLLENIDLPWEGFDWKNLADAVDNIVVSSRVNRKLNGGLHKDTIYSKTYEVVDIKKPDTTKTVHHVRKPLEAMSLGEIEAIVDPAVRQAVLDKLERLGGDPKKAFADRNNHPYLTTKNKRLIPIHRARIQTSVTTIAIGRGSRQRRVAAGDNHHMEIAAVLDKQGTPKKWEGHIVSRFEAVRRHTAGEPVVRRDHGPGKKPVFSLANGEHVLLPGEGDTEPQILRVSVISGQQIEFVPHSDARPITIRKKIPGARIRASVDKLRQMGAMKIAISPLGKWTPAGD